MSKLRMVRRSKRKIRRIFYMDTEDDDYGDDTGNNDDGDGGFHADAASVAVGGGDDDDDQIIDATSTAPATNDDMDDGAVDHDNKDTNVCKSNRRSHRFEPPAYRGDSSNKIISSMCYRNTIVYDNHNDDAGNVVAGNVAAGSDDNNGDFDDDNENHASDDEYDDEEDDDDGDDDDDDDNDDFSNDNTRHGRPPYYDGPEYKHHSINNLLPSLTTKFDLDSITIASSNMHSLFKSLNKEASVTVNCCLKRLKAAHGSRLTVKFTEDSPCKHHGTNLKSLSLGSLPNTTICSITVANHIFFLNLFWLDPPYIPKVPYFDDRILLVLTAAMNYATLSCKAGLFDLDQIDDPQVYINNDRQRSQIRQFSGQFHMFSIFKSGVTVSSDKKLSHIDGMIFFSEFNRCLKAIAKGIYSECSIQKLLPFDYDNASFKVNTGEKDIRKIEADKKKKLSELASMIANSSVYTLSVAGLKSEVQSTYFNQDLCIQNNIPITDTNIRNSFPAYQQESMKILSVALNGYLTEDHISKDVHIYYDIGMEVWHNDDNISFLINLQDTKKKIKDIINEHKIIVKEEMTARDIHNLTESMRSDIHYDDIINIQSNNNEDDPTADISDYLIWNSEICQNIYNTFLINGTGNWHTGNNKVIRKSKAIICFEDDLESSDDETNSEKKVYLEHQPEPGMCNAQQYTPQARIFSLKVIRVAAKDMHALTQILMSLLMNTKVVTSVNFKKLMSRLMTHLQYLENFAEELKNNQIHIRTECLFKFDIENRKINFPTGFLDTKVLVFNTNEFGEFYYSQIAESTKAIKDLFPDISNDHPVYPDMSHLSVEARTAIIFHAELLAAEFSNAFSKGTIMKNLKGTFVHQGYIGLSQKSKLRIPLTDDDKQYCTLPYGLSPSLLPLHLSEPRQPDSRGLIPLDKLQISISLSSISCSRIYKISESSNLPVSYAQHWHLAKSLLHNFLKDPGKYIV